jgi:hypothetical protein
MVQWLKELRTMHRDHHGYTDLIDDHLPERVLGKKCVNVQLIAWIYMKPYYKNFQSNKDGDIAFARATMLVDLNYLTLSMFVYI